MDIKYFDFFFIQELISYLINNSNAIAQGKNKI